MLKCWISILIMFSGILCYAAEVKEPVFASLSPSLTETMYALGAQDMLKAVSTQCSYPKEASKKPVIGDTYYINSEMLLQIKPDYLLAADSAEFMLSRYKHFGITPLCYKYADIDEIYKNIMDLGRLTGKEARAREIVYELSHKIAAAYANNNHKGLKILFLVQQQPIVTIGRKSFITDLIEKSGNISVTSDIDTFYPAVNEEYIINQNPDVIVLDYYSRGDRVYKLFPDTPVIIMTKDETDIIDRPGPRIYKSVEFFASLWDKVQKR